MPTEQTDEAAAAAKAREEHRARLNRHMAKIRKASQEVELARAPFDAAREDLTAVIDEARADLGKKQYTRKRLLSYLEDIGARLRNLMAEEQQRYQDRVDLGLPVYGEQMGLDFGGPETPQAARDLMQTEADGYLAGRRGDEAKPPSDVPGGEFAQAWLKGWGEGQRVIGDLMKKGDELAASRGAPDDSDDEIDLNAGEEDFDADEAARKLKRDPAFMDRSAPGAEFEASEAELASQKPRAAVADKKAGRTTGELEPVH